MGKNLRLNLPQCCKSLRLGFIMIRPVSIIKPATLKYTWL